MTAIKNALWDNNPALVQMIGLCPLLAVSSNVTTAFLLGVCTLVVLIASMCAIAIFRAQVRVEIRLPIFVLLIAGFTTVVDILLQLVNYEFYLLIGLFIPLITTNCLLLARAESFASNNSLSKAFFDALWMGLGFAWVLIILGMLRELMGHGTLFASLSDILPFWPETWVLRFELFDGIPLFALPPGGFLALGLLLVGRNFLVQRKQSQVKSSYAEQRTKALS